MEPQRIVDSGLSPFPELTALRVKDFDPRNGTLEGAVNRSVPSSSRSNPGQDQSLEATIRPDVRLLVADDHSVVRRGATSWLEAQAGYRVVGEAETSNGAAEQAALIKPDIVLLDVGLPKEGGISAASKIVRVCPTTDVVAFSVSADRVHVRGMLAAGAKAYVLKTSEPSVLLSAIRAVRKGSRFLDPGLSDVVIEELVVWPEATRRSAGVLTPRETQVLERIVWGHTNREISSELHLTIHTVDTYRNRICGKLSLTSRAEIVRYGIATGVIDTAALTKLHTGSKYWACSRE